MTIGVAGFNHKFVFGVHCVLTRNDSQLIEAAAFGCLGMVGDMVGVAYWQISYGHQGHHGKVGLSFNRHRASSKSGDCI